MASAVCIYSQNTFSSNMYNNLVFSNPSIAEFNDFSIFQLNYRNQWPIAGMFNTYGLSGFYQAENLNSNFGLTIVHDIQYKGALTNTSAGINYAYRLQINRRNYLLFGINGNYHFQRLNYSSLTFENPSVDIPLSQSNKFPLLNTGVSYLINKTHLIGFSVTDILHSQVNALSSRAFHLTYLSHIEIKTYNSLLTYIEPLVQLSYYSNYINYSYGCNFGLYNFKSGFFFTQSGFKLNSVGLLLGISFDNYQFIYTYDINLSGIISVNPKMVAHEVTFLRKFQYKGKRKKHKAIKCPDL